MLLYLFVFIRNKHEVEAYQAQAANDAVAAGYARGAAIKYQADKVRIFKLPDNDPSRSPRFICTVKPIYGDVAPTQVI